MVKGLNMFKSIKIYIKFVISSLLSQLPNKYRFGHDYNTYYKFLYDSASWPEQEKINFQIRQLNKIIKTAKKVPYYKDLFKDSNCQIESLSELETIPVLSKEIIRNNPELFENNECPKSKVYKNITGGSTGIPLVFNSSKPSDIKELATLDFIINKVGINTDKTYRKLVFRGNFELPNDRESLKIGNILYLSPFSLNESKLERYSQLISDFQPELIHTNPSSIVNLVKYCKNNKKDLKLLKLKGILTSSETFLEYDKKLVRDYFQTRICDLYGNTERSILGFHLDGNAPEFPFSYSIVEVDDNQQLISTSLIEEYFPFIRYKSGDRVELLKHTVHDETIYEYGKILGREQDFIEANDGAKTYLYSLNFHDDSFSGIDCYQLYQSQPGKLRVNVISAQGFDRKKLEHFLKVRLINVEVEIISVEKLLQTKAGKTLKLIKDY